MVFQWSSPTGKFPYQFQIGPDPFLSKDRLITTQENLKESTLSLKLPAGSNSYYWRVREADRIGSGVPKAVPYKLRHFKYMVEKVSKDPISVKMLAIDGTDVMRILGSEPGPKIGLVLNALLGLGYSEKEALAAVKGLPAGLAVTEGIRAALKALAKS